MAKLRTHAPFTDKVWHTYLMIGGTPAIPHLSPILWLTAPLKGKQTFQTACAYIIASLITSKSAIYLVYLKFYFYAEKSL